MSVQTRDFATWKLSEQIPLQRHPSVNLRALLGDKPTLIESGLRLIDPLTRKDGRQPSYFDMVDLLARDEQGNLVIVMLKQGRASVRLFGQLTHCIARIRREFSVQGQTVRGIIVASEISKELIETAEIVPEIRLVQYAYDVVFSEPAQFRRH